MQSSPLKSLRANEGSIPRPDTLTSQNFPLQSHDALKKRGGPSETTRTRDGGARPRNRSPRWGRNPGKRVSFPGLNQIPAPETNHERQMNRDLAYWSRPFGKPGDTVGSSRGRGDFFTFSKNSSKNGKNPRGSAKTAAAGGAHSCTFLNAHPHSFSRDSKRLPLETRQSWG